MHGITVTEGAIRKLVRKALNGTQRLAEMGGLQPQEPVRVVNVVDPQAAETDPKNPRYLPQDKVEFTVAIRQLLDANPEADYQEIFRIVKMKLDDDEGGGETMNVKEQVEAALRRKVRAVIKEAMPAYARGGQYGQEDFERDKAWLQRKFGEEEEPEGKDNYTPKRVRGSKNNDEQASQIIRVLNSEFGIDMKGSQFQSFDKATKLRWFATAYISEHDPRFLERTVADYIEALEEAADESGVLDDTLIEELKDLERELLKNPSISDAFSEYLQQEVQTTINSMDPEQYKTFMGLAQLAFDDVPGGIMKFGAGGAEKPEDVRTWAARRQSSKQFTGGGDPKTGGGSAVDRFRAAVDHPAVPPEK